MTEWAEELFENASNIQPHEPPSDYQPGGFHPTSLEDSFHEGQYVVKHKLGFGGQATVWLARDTRAKYVMFPNTPFIL